jgi:hypothetical protein
MVSMPCCRRYGAMPQERPIIHGLHYPFAHEATEGLPLLPICYGNAARLSRIFVRTSLVRRERERHTLSSQVEVHKICHQRICSAGLVEQT